MNCDCKVITKLIMDLRQSMREEQAAVDSYFERGNRAEEAEEALKPESHEDIFYNLANLYRGHVLPEEQQHFDEFEDALFKLAREARAQCACDLSFLKDMRGL